MPLVHPSITSKQRYVSLVFVFLSFAMFLGTVYFTFDAWNLSRDGNVIGKIVALDRKNRPTIHFKIRDGRHVTFQDGTSSSLLNYAVGDNVKVVFRANHPQDAQVAGNQWGFPIMLGILAFGFGCGGIAGLRGLVAAGPLRQRRINIGIK